MTTSTATTPAAAAGQDSKKVQDRVVPLTTTPGTAASQDSLQIQDRVIVPDTTVVSPGVPPTSSQQEGGARTKETTPTARAAIKRSLKAAGGRERATHSLPIAAGAEPITQPVTKLAANSGAQPAANPQPLVWLDQQKNRAQQCQNRFSKSLPADKSLSEKERARVVRKALQAVSPTAGQPGQHSVCRGGGQAEELNNIDSTTIQSFPSNHHTELTVTNLEPVLTSTVPGHQHSGGLRGESNADSMAARKDGSTDSDAQLASILQDDEYSKVSYHDHTPAQSSRPPRTVGGSYQPPRDRNQPYRAVGGMMHPPPRTQRESYQPPGAATEDRNQPYRAVGGIYPPPRTPRESYQPPGAATGDRNQAVGGIFQPPRTTGGRYQYSGAVGAGKSEPSSASRGAGEQSDFVLAQLMQEEVDEQSAMQMQRETGR